MEISEFIIEEAKNLLQGSSALILPAQLPSAPAFFLAAGSDDSIIAFMAFTEGGDEYKIGPRRAVN